MNGKIGRVANEDVVLQLLSSKCLPSLMYGLEACPLVKSDLSSLDFVVNRFFIKLFKTNNIDVVKTFKTCQHSTVLQFRDAKHLVEKTLRIIRY